LHHNRNLALRTVTRSMGINIAEGQDHSIVTPLHQSTRTHESKYKDCASTHVCMCELPMCVAPFIIVLSRFIVSVACLSSAPSTSGHTDRSGSYSSSIRDDCWCVETIRKFEKGKIIAWAWLSRGLVSPEQITEWLHDGDFESFKKSMQKVMSFVSKECIHMYIRPSHSIRDTTHQSLGPGLSFLCVSRLIRTFPSCHLALPCSCTGRV